MSNRYQNHSKKKKKKLSAKYTLFIMTLVCLASVFISLTVGLSGGPLQSVAGVVFVPMQKGLNYVGDTISGFTLQYRTMADLQKENEALRKEVEELKSDITLLEMEQFDVEEYRQLLKLSEFYADQEKVGASVIAKDSGSWFSTFSVDKGAKDGIEEGMNVLCQNGLCGVITSVGPNYSVVRTIIDDTSNVSAMDLKTKNTMNIVGSLETMEKTRTLAFSQLRDADDVVGVGDPVVTSYISDRYHAEILIGYISTIEKDPNNLTKSGTIAPVVDFLHIQNVLIITEQKPQPQPAVTDEE